MSPAPHVGPFAVGISGRVYCTGCLRGADSADTLNTIACVAEFFED